MSTWSKSIMMSDCYLYPFEIEMGGIFLLTKSYLWERVVATTAAFGRKVICERESCCYYCCIWTKSYLWERELLLLLQHLDGKLFVRELLLLLQHLDEKLFVRESCCYYCSIWTESYLWESCCYYCSIWQASARRAKIFSKQEETEIQQIFWIYGQTVTFRKSRSLSRQSG